MSAGYPDGCTQAMLDSEYDRVYEPEGGREDSPYARHVKESDQRREDAQMGICLACGKYWRGVHLEKWMCRCDAPRGVPPYCYDHNMKDPCFLCREREIQ